jgi:hypothetical protein
VRGDSNRKGFGSRRRSPGRRKTMVFWSKSGDVWRSWAPRRVQWGRQRMVKVFGALGAVGNLQGGRAARNSADRFEPEKWGKTKWGGCLVGLADAMEEGGGDRRH